MNRARSKTAYAVTSLHKNYILVKTYGDLCLLKNYDPQTKKLGDNVIIEGIGHLPNETLSIERTGRVISRGSYSFL